MTTSVTTSGIAARPKPGDLAYVVGAGFGEIPLYRIVKIDTDGDGKISVYHLADSSNPANQGAPVPAKRVAAVFSNILSQE